MNLILLLSFSGVFLLVSYFTYGNFIAKKLKINNLTKTPAHSLKDHIDYVPTKKFIVLGHHFASIAGAGPIIGPIIAVTFGWIPAVIWILLGGVFFGAVHDTTSMVASLRHKGKSIGTIIQSYIGHGGKRLFLIFSFATLILIIAVFADIIAKTFVKNPGVASASGLFIVLAIVFGRVNRHFENKKNAFLILSIIGVGLMYVFIFLGTEIPLELNYSAWVFLLLAYSFVASVTPMTFLLQPRDYLSSFLLYGLMILAIVGIVIANPEIKMDNNIVIDSENMGYLFPVLFVTVACGAISGFHSLVASGTTSKQIDKEGDVKMVGFGGMLIESFLAIISVGAVIVLERADYTALLFADGPVNMFADGLGFIISSLGISETLAVTFVALTISAFALTTLDTCTRLARFTFQEYFEDVKHPKVQKVSQNRFFATTIVVVMSVLMLLSGEFSALWPIFGSANQLLAALALLAVAVWLYKIKENATFVLIPMFFMFTVTLSSLFLFALENYHKGIYMLSLIAGLLFLLSIVLIRLAFKSLKQHPEKVNN
ncbi:carbon starvation protein A [Marivirga sp. S37H4]|uniref:Carbon starvation protein A n=1 Tax=Marivirga aurantiaca TaxID=2802615 RepID=A0A935C8E2_9BACT|nr:carbon starvation protein A [Marivirga aurantiaca]MBK6265450.1 carbon starvation protein A [Marivirga aurantiaca]